MIEIFKTNIQEQSQADKVFHSLMVLLPDSKINFDLDDSDKILRIENEIIDSGEIRSVVQDLGFLCKVIPDKVCKKTNNPL